MLNAGSKGELNEYLEIFGQSPSLSKLYTQISCCYAMPDETPQTATIEALRQGLRRLTASFPWIAGQVIREDHGEGHSGVFRLVAHEDIPRLIVKDYTHTPTVPTWDQLRQHRFPFHMLDESIFAPCPTLGILDPTLELAPVFMLQANFIAGGLILTFNGQHNVMDMTGQAEVIRLLAKACRGEAFTDVELVTGNPQRRNVIDLFDESYQPGPEVEHQIVKAAPNATEADHSSGHDMTTPGQQLPDSSWAYFVFSPVSLTALKAEAIRHLSSAYISTDDALTAFVWQSVARVRCPRLGPSALSTLARAIDPRRFVNLLPSYPGILQNMTYHTGSINELVDTPLGAIASRLRTAIDPKTSQVTYQTRALATLLHRTRDKSTISVTASLDLSTDLALSSWMAVNLHEHDFGLGLGRPEAVRRPQFTPVESLIYLLPKAPNGEVAVGVCLRDEDMIRLKEDAPFCRYAEYVG